MPRRRRTGPVRAPTRPPFRTTARGYSDSVQSQISSDGQQVQLEDGAWVEHVDVCAVTLKGPKSKLNQPRANNTRATPKLRATCFLMCVPPEKCPIESA